MAFDSFNAFLVMGGHGPFVWTCYLVFFTLSLVLILWSRQQHKAAFKGLARHQATKSEASHRNASADFARVRSSEH